MAVEQPQTRISLQEVQALPKEKLESLSRGSVVDCGDGWEIHRTRGEYSRGPSSYDQKGNEYDSWCIFRSHTDQAVKYYLNPSGTPVVPVIDSQVHEFRSFQDALKLVELNRHITAEQALAIIRRVEIDEGDSFG